MASHVWRNTSDIGLVWPPSPRKLLPEINFAKCEYIGKGVSNVNRIERGIDVTQENESCHCTYLNKHSIPTLYPFVSTCACVWVRWFTCGENMFLQNLV